MKSFVSFLIIIITISALMYGGFIGLTAFQSKVRSEAVDGCLHASLYRTSFTTPDGGEITTETAIDSDVNKCLEKKGIVQ
ncbi:hypothetical protein KA078_01505 [Candidatus Woesebacteria bacterium]|nr:hypothetical protein [Candidatus Woesebacteria bacterium]